MNAITMKRQHLIDPAICIRCNTCEATCPVHAITHDANNYVVDVDKCEECRACVSPCPTGAIDNWHLVARAWTLEEQFSWDELPPQTAQADEAPAPEPGEVAAIMEVAHSATGGHVPPPWSAAHPYVNLYSREKPITARVAGNYRITDADAESDVHHIVLDFGLKAFPVIEGQSIGIIPPGTDARGRPHMMRLYSVASPRDGERPRLNNLSLTVKRVAGGVASNFLCDLQKDDTVQVTGPFGNSFLMPNHPEANIIMICTGTGSAPFRAFTERRRRKMPDVPGKLMLFFGARTPGELPYFGPLTKLPKTLIDTNLAFSRVPGEAKEYVQDKMRRRAADVGRLLRSDHTFVFICGLKGMEQGCDEAFADICREYDLDWAVLRDEMRRQGRYHVETY